MEQCLSFAEIRNYIGKVYNENDGPLKRDLEDTISGLLITQFVYDLKSPDVGKIAPNFPFTLNRKS